MSWQDSHVCMHVRVHADMCACAHVCMCMHAHVLVCEREREVKGVSYFNLHVSDIYTSGPHYDKTFQ